jgi:hypothetical protein
MQLYTTASNHLCSGAAEMNWPAHAGAAVTIDKGADRKQNEL